MSDKEKTFEEKRQALYNAMVKRTKPEDIVIVTIEMSEKDIERRKEVADFLKQLDEYEKFSRSIKLMIK